MAHGVVQKIVDGDTVWIRLGTVTEKTRLTERWAASTALEGTVPNSRVRKPDVSVRRDAVSVSCRVLVYWVPRRAG
jgi:hypothetical protein